MNKKDNTVNYDLLLHFPNMACLAVEQALIYADLEGLIKMGAPGDEYSSEALKLTDSIIQSILSETKITKKLIYDSLSEVMWESFEHGTNPVTGEKSVTMSYEVYLTKINKKRYNQAVTNIIKNLTRLCNESSEMLQYFYALNREEFKSNIKTA